MLAYVPGCIAEYEVVLYVLAPSSHACVSIPLLLLLLLLVELLVKPTYGMEPVVDGFSATLELVYGVETSIIRHKNQIQQRNKVQNL